MNIVPTTTELFEAVKMMDEFELAGFDKETCEQLRKISEESGISPEIIIGVLREYKSSPPEWLDDQDPYTRFAEVWNDFKKAMWEEFTDSRFGRFMIRIADKLSAFLERKTKNDRIRNQKE